MKVIPIILAALLAAIPNTVLAAPVTRPTNDLNAQIMTARTLVAQSHSEEVAKKQALSAARSACIAKFHDSDAYRAAGTAVAEAEKRLATAREGGDPYGKLNASSELNKGKARIVTLETSALSADQAVNRANTEHDSSLATSEEANLRLAQLLATPILPVATDSQPKAVAQGDEKFSGFRGIKWGTDLTQMSSMSPANLQRDTAGVRMPDGNSITVKNVNTKSYNRTSDKLDFGDVPVKQITYNTFDGAFYEVYIDTEVFSDLKSVFIRYFGEPEETTLAGANFYEWDGRGPSGDKVHITMFYAERLGGHADIVNCRLKDQLDAAQLQQAKEQLSRSQKDF